jgi:GAF domain-containing protein
MLDMEPSTLGLLVLVAGTMALFLTPFLRINKDIGKNIAALKLWMIGGFLLSTSLVLVFYPAPLPLNDLRGISGTVLAPTGAALFWWGASRFRERPAPILPMAIGIGACVNAYLIFDILWPNFEARLAVTALVSGTFWCMAAWTLGPFHSTDRDVGRILAASAMAVMGVAILARAGAALLLTEVVRPDVPEILPFAAILAASFIVALSALVVMIEQDKAQRLSDELKRQLAGADVVRTMAHHIAVEGRAALEELCVKARAHLDVRAVSVWKIEAERMTRLEWSSLDRMDETNTTLERANHPEYFALLETGTTIICNDVRVDTTPALQAHARRGDLAGMLEVPIISDGFVIGVVCVDHGSPRVWRPDEISFARSVAGLASLTCDKAKRRAMLARNLTPARKLDEQISDAISQLNLLNEEIVRLRAVAPAEVQLAVDFQHFLEAGSQRARAARQMLDQALAAAGPLPSKRIDPCS